jgi:hypothetical protein
MDFQHPGLVFEGRCQKMKWEPVQMPAQPLVISHAVWTMPGTPHLRIRGCWML